MKTTPWGEVIPARTRVVFVVALLLGVAAFFNTYDVEAQTIGGSTILSFRATDGTYVSVGRPGQNAINVYVVGSAGGGSAVSIADGDDVVEGTLADSAVITDAAGTVSGKLRGLVKWAYERMPASLGQKAMTASLPVVIASDQTALTSNPTNYAVRVDEASSTITYVGQAVPGTATSSASWSIKRIDTTSGTVILWANGTAAFTQIWDNRAALPYS